MPKSHLLDRHPLPGHSLVPVIMACAVAAAGSCLFYPAAAGATEGGGRQRAAGIEAGAIPATRLETDAERGQRMQELRRQLLEHDRHWRSAANSRHARETPETQPTQGVRQVSVIPGLSLPSWMVDGIIPAAAPRRVPEPPAAPSGGGLPAASETFRYATETGQDQEETATTPFGRDPASGAIVDSRLSERERSLLRQQLLQVGRSQALRGDR